MIDGNIKSTWSARTGDATGTKATGKPWIGSEQYVLMYINMLLRMNVYIILYTIIYTYI
jgi:hypothetical protein